MKKFSTIVIAAVAGMRVFLSAQAAHAGIGNGVPVPEPSTLALLSAGAGIVAIGAWWRNRRK